MSYPRVIVRSWDAEEPTLGIGPLSWSVSILAVCWAAIVTVSPEYLQTVSWYYAAVLTAVYAVAFVRYPPAALVPLAAIIGSEPMIRVAGFLRYNIAHWLVIFLLLRIVARRGIPKVPSFVLWWFVYFGVYALSILWTLPSVRSSAIRTGLPYIGAGAVIVLLLMLREEREIIMLAAGCYVVAVLAIAFHFLVHPAGEFRMMEGMTNPAGPTNAMAVGVFLSIALLTCAKQRSFAKLMLLASVFALNLTIILGLSRKTILALALGAGAFTVFAPGTSRRAKVFLAVGLVGVAVLAWSYAVRPESLTHRWHQTVGVSMEKATAGRWYFWRAASIHFARHPVGGTGAHSFRYYFGDYLWRLVGYSQTPRVAHSLYFRVLAEQGLLGFVPLILFTVLLGRSVLACSPSWEKAVCVGMVTFHILSLVAAQLIAAPPWFGLAVALALASSVGNRAWNPQASRPGLATIGRDGP